MPRPLVALVLLVLATAGIVIARARTDAALEADLWAAATDDLP